MTCLKPKYAYYNYANVISKKTGEIERQKLLKFTNDINQAKLLAPDKNYLTIPCGKCKGCLIDKANDWATRAWLEAINYPKSAFITLTYDNEHLPKNNSLIKSDVQKFIKRLRKAYDKPIRYILAGEYGDHSTRAHYHMLAFNYWPDDCKFYKTGTDKEDMLFISRKLEKIWGKGLCVIGKITYESASYVCRYTLKKIFRDKEFWKKYGREPEFILTSRKGGIGISAFNNKEKWAEILRNNGIWVMTKNGAKLKNIPQFLKNKWLENERFNYQSQQEKNARTNKTLTRARLEKTDKNLFQIQKDLKEKIEKSIKRLDKRV